MSLAAYAERRGIYPAAVQRAARSGRLKASLCLVNGKWKVRDPEHADREWEANSDYTDAPQRAPRKPTPVLVAEKPKAPTPTLTVDEWGDVLAANPPTVRVETPAVEMESDGTISAAAERQKHWQAKLAEQKFRVAAGELVEAKEVEQRLMGVFGECKTKLLGVVSGLRQADPTLTVEQLALVESEIRAALTVLAGDVGPDGE